MDVFYSYTYSTAAWLGIQALPLLISPKLIVTMLAEETRKPTALEVYFCRSLGITLITLGILTVLLTGSVPLTSTFAESSSAAVSTDATDPKAPYAVPTLTLTASFHAASAFYAYTQYMKTGQTSFALSVVGFGSLAAMGLWVLLFGSSSGRISRKTGADKRTSGFPFSNAEASKKKAGRKRL
ncbi:hypothetical protein MMC24_000274 [Lignoscripta atroalba]|nr:hypothetical protein [Lignoscripta atroalba]